MSSVASPQEPGDCMARRLDEIAANATPASTTTVIDGWLCKRDPDLPFRRANAVLPPVAAGRDPVATAGALAAIEDWYCAAGQRMLIQVSSADPAAGALDALLAERGDGIEAPVDLLIADLPVVAERASRERGCSGKEGPGAKDSASGGLGSGEATMQTRRSLPGQQLGALGFGVTVDRGCDPGWTQRSGDLRGADARSSERTVGYRRMLRSFGRRALWASASADELGPDPGDHATRHPIGVGFAVTEQGWMGLFGMETSPEWRGRGVATALVGALAAHGATNGLAERLYLQVETDNAPAQALYRGLGFTRHHGYHYRVSKPCRPTAEEPVDFGC